MNNFIPSLLIFGQLIYLSYGLVCKECTNITISQLCNRTVSCNQGERCYTKTAGYGADLTITMGCKQEKECLAPALIGRSLRDTNKRSVECSQCCSVDQCNQHLCSKGTTVITEVGHCQDDPNFDCMTVSSSFSICSDIEHAKVQCRRWCGLCQLVDGAWTTWTPWGECDTTCGSGHMIRIRSCTDPEPAHGGLNCSGSSSELKTCQKPSCPVNGGWNPWQTWSTCSVTCGAGLVKRRRICENPKPAFGGSYCVGDNVGYKICSLPTCKDDVVVFYVHSATGGNVSAPGNITGKIPLFSQVPINIGGGYNNTTGIFICPISGLYQFAMNFDIRHGEYTYCFLTKGNSLLAHARANANGDYPSASMSVYTTCDAGDTVYPNCGHTDNLDTNEGTTLSGALITSFS